MCKNYFKNMIKIEKNKIALVGFPEAIFIKDMINQIPHDQYDISVKFPTLINAFIKSNIVSPF